MDYASMTTPQLQAECKDRGLPSARAKADLVQRLTEHDAAAADEGGEPTAAPAADGEHALTVADAAPQTPTGDAPTVEAAPAPEPATSPAGPFVFHHSFPAGPEGPDEEEHLAYRQTTRQAAVEAGLLPRGDAYRTGTVDGHEVYEVRVRAAS